jgi:hypothetical protein
MRSGLVVVDPQHRLGGGDGCSNHEIATLDALLAVVVVRPVRRATHPAAAERATSAALSHCPVSVRISDAVRNPARSRTPVDVVAIASAAGFLDGEPLNRSGEPSAERGWHGRCSAP